jgi:uncharacterized repeat protein (TIGR01451 family)
LRRLALQLVETRLIKLLPYSLTTDCAQRGAAANGVVVPTLAVLTISTQVVNQFLTRPAYACLLTICLAWVNAQFLCAAAGRSFGMAQGSMTHADRHPQLSGVSSAFGGGRAFAVLFHAGENVSRAVAMGRLIAIIAFMMWLTAALSSNAFAADAFPGPALGIGGSFVDTNVGTTGETGEPTTLPAGSTLNTQWYSWTAPVSGFVSFGTCNPTGSSLTNFDTTIGIYTGSAVNALTQIGFNDDTPGCNSVVNANYGSTVAFNAVAGTTYRIQVDGYNATTGQFNLFYGYSGYTTNVTGATATEGGGTGAFTIVLNAVPTGTATITIGTSPQCTFAPSTLTFTSANWNVIQTVTATAIDDVIVEGGHFCAPASITPSGGGVVGSAAPPPTISVTDNDTATVTIANTTNGAEASPANGAMTITQSKVSTTDTVIAYTVTGTASSGADYTALSGTVTILAGQTTATITIPVLDDAIVEGNETVIVTMNSLTGTAGVALGVAATRTATNTIADNDTATLTLANTTNGNETGPVSGVMTITQSAVSSVATVISYSAGGTATSGSDYTALSGTVTIAAGQTTATITIPVINDVAVEGNESVVLTLTSVSSGLATLGTPVTATNTIFDNDAPTVTIANTTPGNEAGPVNGVMTVTMSATQPAAVIVAYSVTGTATSGADFTALAGQVTIAAGATTATITIPVINDVIVEGNETVILTLTSIVSGTASLGAPAGLVATNTIADNDAATVAIASTSGSAEGGAPAIFTVTQSLASSTVTIINLTFAGTATSGTDYAGATATITIPAGSTSATITLAIVDDAVLDPAETIIATLASISSAQTGITLGSPAAATNTITDNDVASFTIAKAVNIGNISTPQTLTYTITVKNTGTVPLTSPVVADTLSDGAALTLTSGPTLTSGDAGTLGVVDIGETWIYTATYAVTQAKIDGGNTISNFATFKPAEAALQTSTTVTTTITRTPQLTTLKTASTAGPVPAGTVITYTYKVTNSGNVTMSNVVVSDSHNGTGTFVGPDSEVVFTDVAPALDSTDAAFNASWDSLAPGDTIKFTATYTVTQHDVDFLQ